jgi:dihydrofolate synthase/folylpolyglutamate synthase
MIFGREKFGEGIGLHRMLAFIEEAGIDREALAQRSIVVTGSKGKGSTARFVVAALESAGLSAGCFTSPHMFSVRERFTIGDQEIPQPDFDRLARRVLDFSERRPQGDRMGAFEFLFLVALLWFEERQPGVIIWEAGIGGRYDPVRVLGARVSVLASIELEHTQILGATEELIAYDKADALAHGGELIVSPSIPANLVHRLRSYCAISGRRLTLALDGRRMGGVTNSAMGSAFSLSLDAEGPERHVAIGLIGRHQAQNAVSALRAAEVWLGPDRAPNYLDRMISSLSTVRWRGRLEKVAEAPDLWLDVGHTPHAIEAATEAFLDIVPRERVLVVFGATASKDIRRMGDILAARFDRFILASANRSGAPVAELFPAFAGRDVTLAASTTQAAEIARSRAASEGLTVLAIGGLFLAAEVAHAWNGGDPAELDFL